MIKWALGIAIAVTFVAGMLVTPEQVYAPPTKPDAITFNFVGTVTGQITMTGHGAWKVNGQIGAGGTFTDLTSGTQGTWRAISLTSPACVAGCVGAAQSTSPTNVVFAAQFKPNGGTPFLADVIVNSGILDISAGGAGGGGVHDFWVQPTVIGGFGTTSIANFNSR